MTERNRVHSDISIKFDKFDSNRVIKINLSDMIDTNVVPIDYLHTNDGFVLYNLFTENECKRIIEVTNNIGYEELEGYDKNMRDNTRIKCQSTTIIKEWENRILQFLDKELIVDDNVTTLNKAHFHNGLWTYNNLNPIIRFCKYSPSQKFEKHYDSGINPDPLTMRTFKTCMTYLNDDYDDGCTRFFHIQQSGSHHKHVTYPIFLNLKAKPGMCLIFNQNIFHDGQQVKNGYKYMMRTDVIYKAKKLDKELTESEKEGIRLYGDAIKLDESEGYIKASKLYEKATELCYDAYMMYD